MSETSNKNLEIGRLLLVATLLLSLTLVSQLYVISESIDISNGIQLNINEICLIVSYIFASISMVIVINEFFQVKIKLKSLLASNTLNGSGIQDEAQSGEILTVGFKQNPISKFEVQRISEKDIDDESELEKLIEKELDEQDSVGDSLSEPEDDQENVEIIEPLVEEGELQNVFDELEEENEVERLLSESEVIATLAELEALVEELRQKKMPLLAL